MIGVHTAILSSTLAAQQVRGQTARRVSLLALFPARRTFAAITNTDCYPICKHDCTRCRLASLIEYMRRRADIHTHREVYMMAILRFREREKVTWLFKYRLQKEARRDFCAGRFSPAPADGSVGGAPKSRCRTRLESARTFQHRSRNDIILRAASGRRR